MKPTIIKVWPELGPATCAMFPFKSMGSVFTIDLGGVSQVSSCGLALLLLRLRHLLSKNGKFYHVRESNNLKVRRLAADLGFNRLLREGMASELTHHQQDLDLDNEMEVPESGESASRGSKHFPIYKLRFSKGAPRRQGVDEFFDEVSQRLSDLASRFLVRSNVILMILREIAKNSADHTDGDAFFGMDLKTGGSNVSLSFVFADLGIGIKRHIEKHLPPELKRRRAKFDLAQAYRLALTDGYSSGSLPVNRGFGLPIILDNANSIGMELSVYDANSRGILTKLSAAKCPSHALVRRHFYTISHHAGFCYHGEIKLTKRLRT